MEGVNKLLSLYIGTVISIRLYYESDHKDRYTIELLEIPLEMLATWGAHRKV